MNPIKTLDLKCEIVYMKSLEKNALALAGSDHGFRIINAKSYENSFSIKLNGAKQIKVIITSILV